MVQGADGCTMVTGASDSIDLMTPQPLRFMCSGAVLPLQCFTLGDACRQRVIQQTCGALCSTMRWCPAGGPMPETLLTHWAVFLVQLSWAAGAALPRKGTHKVQMRDVYN